MSSASPDRSISSGLSLPQWMKTKIGDRYDLEQAAFSPPSEDDSFFFIKYPLSGSKSEDKSSEITMKRSSTAPGNQLGQNLEPLKESSDYGKSMASVAHNLITGKIFGGYLYPETSTNSNLNSSNHHRQRRNSKSLPTSPLASPKISRKNPYFTDPFAKSYETYDGKQSWILSILSQRKSIEDLTSNNELSTSENNSPNIMRRNYKYSSDPLPKPSELREMNFWSPVSM